MSSTLETFIKKYRKTDLLKRYSATFPRLAYYTVYLPVSYIRYSNERKLERGQAVSTSQHPSIILFTIHKCASTLVTKILKEVSESSQMVHVDFDSYFTTVAPEKYEQFNEQTFQTKAIKPQGYYYGAWRHYRPVNDLEKYKVLLILRDPRDVLTSMYFSVAFSHSPVSKKLLDKREQVVQLDIDDFVLQKAPDIRRIYKEYVDHLLGQPSVLHLRYEDMVADFPKWVDRLTEHVGLNEEQAIIDGFKNSLSFKVSKEDKHSHIRNIQPGDHRQKLKTSTIDRLNDIFKEVLQPLGYED